MHARWQRFLSWFGENNLAALRILMTAAVSGASFGAEVQSLFQGLMVAFLTALVLTAVAGTWPWFRRTLNSDWRD